MKCHPFSVLKTKVLYNKDILIVRYDKLLQLVYWLWMYSFVTFVLCTILRNCRKCCNSDCLFLDVVVPRHLFKCQVFDVVLIYSKPDIKQTRASWSVSDKLEYSNNGIIIYSPWYVMTSYVLLRITSVGRVLGRSSDYMWPFPDFFFIWTTC